MNSQYTGTPWRAVFTRRDGWVIRTKLDKTPGNRNNYDVAIGIQDENEAKVLAAAPELAGALRECADVLSKLAQTARIEGRTEQQNYSEHGAQVAVSVLANLEGRKT